MLSLQNYVKKQQSIKFSSAEPQFLITSHRHFNSSLSEAHTKTTVMGAVTLQYTGEASAHLREKEGSILLLQQPGYTGPVFLTCPS